MEKNFANKKPVVRACQRQIENCERFKNEFVEELAGKQPHETFEKYVSAELKEMIVTETNLYAAQKNADSTFTATDLETFNAVLILTGYHSLPRTRMLWEKEKDIDLWVVYESISRKKFGHIKSYINFTDSNQLDTKDKFFKVRKLYKNKIKAQEQGTISTFYE